MFVNLCLSYSMNNLNCLLLICMGLFTCHQWGWYGGHDFFYNGKIPNTSFNIIQNLLSHWTIWVMVWLNVIGFDIVNNKSLTSLCNPNWNWLMSAISSHEISHVDYLNSNAYMTIRRGLWWSDHNLLIDVHSCLNFQKWHSILQQMLQNCSTMGINIPTKAQTTKRLCL